MFRTFICLKRQSVFPLLLWSCVFYFTIITLSIIWISSRTNNKNLVGLELFESSNIPTEYWDNKYHIKRSRDNVCAKFPDLLELEFNNIYWQTLRSSNGTFYLYSAYYDDRLLNQLGPTVRILAMIDRVAPQLQIYCKLWFDDLQEPVVVKNSGYQYIWNKKWGTGEHGDLLPYLLSCQIPNNKIPVFVSVVEKPCDLATNNLRVVNERPVKKGRFAVCVKWLDYLHEDISLRFVEWIELLGILGVEKVFVYSLNIHENLNKVLKYYQTTGQVDVRHHTLAGGQPNLPGLQHIYLQNKINIKIQNELIPINDCLYRNLYSYKYIVILDTDEVIIPTKRSTWNELMEDILSENITDVAWYHVTNVYFIKDLIYREDNKLFHDIPGYMYILQHVYRNKNYSQPFFHMKSFLNPEKVLTTDNHAPIACLSADCDYYSINTSDAHLQHYRVHCTDHVDIPQDMCETVYRLQSVIDTTVWKYKQQLIDKVKKTLYNVELLLNEM